MAETVHQKRGEGSGGARGRWVNLASVQHWDRADLGAQDGWSAAMGHMWRQAGGAQVQPKHSSGGLRLLLTLGPSASCGVPGGV